MKRLFLIMFFLAISVQSDAAKMSSYTDNTTPNEDVYFVGVDPNDTSQTVNGSNYRYSINSIMGLGLIDAVFNSLSVSGTGDSWLELNNNTTFTDSLTGKYGLRFYNGVLQQIINGTASSIGSGGSAPTIQADDPTIGSTTGWYLAQTSGDLFYVNYGIEMFAIAGTRTADETAPLIVAGADSTHDGTPVTATMALTELYPYPSTLLYTVTGGTPASGTWTGTYPNYSLEVTPTGTDNIVVTSSASDLAGNVATGTDLVQEFTYDSGSLYTTSFSDDFNRADNTNVIADGPGWTSEIDTGGIASILNNEYSVALNGTNTCRITKTFATNNTDYEVKFKFKLSDVTDIDTSGTERSLIVDQVYTGAGLYIALFIQCDTSGQPYRFGVSRVNDAGSITTTHTNFTFVADQYINITIQADIGVAATSDGVCTITADSTTLLNLTGLVDETRPVISENRFGIDTGDTIWNQALTVTYDDFVYGYK